MDQITFFKALGVMDVRRMSKNDVKIKIADVNAKYGLHEKESIMSVVLIFKSVPEVTV